MTIEELHLDAASGVETVFGGMAVFSCLTGSILDAPLNSNASDIDLLVVLRDDIELEDAVIARGGFTRFYLGLHRRFGRAPDLEWPGEVLYQRDIDDALRGATFDRVRTLGAAPELCPLDQPYRYWISMVATGLPLTGVEAFECYAQRCARLVTTHATARLMNDDLEVDRYWWEYWQLPVPNDAGRTWCIARYAVAGADRLYGTAMRPYEPAVAPRLESYADRWSRIARCAD